MKVQHIWRVIYIHTYTFTLITSSCARSLTVAAFNPVLVEKRHDVSSSSGVYLLEIRNKSGYCNLTQVLCILVENETLPSFLSIYIFWPCPRNDRGNYLENVGRKKEKVKASKQKILNDKTQKIKSSGVP